MRPQRSRIFFCKPIAYIFDNDKSQNITQYSLRVKLSINGVCRYFCAVSLIEFEFKNRWADGI